jgi:hypothetical protein
MRRFLEAAGRKGDLSRFVEEAVKWRLLEESLRAGPKPMRRSANDAERPPVEPDEVVGRQQSG